MRLIVTGHRDEKLETYNRLWIKAAIEECLLKLKNCPGISIAYAGMASGVDLTFCESCQFYDIPFIACVPFEGQEKRMTEDAARFRKELLEIAKEIKYVKNSWMVENCDYAIAVWDGNKGGTHNVVQQLIEKKKNWLWVNPVSEVIWDCFVGA